MIHLISVMNYKILFRKKSRRRGNYDKGTIGEFNHRIGGDDVPCGKDAAAQ